MQFDLIRIKRRKLPKNVIDLLFDPMASALKNRNASQNKICLVGIPDRAGFIGVEKVHSQTGKGRPKAA